VPAYLASRGDPGGLGEIGGARPSDNPMRLGNKMLIVPRGTFTGEC